MNKPKIVFLGTHNAGRSQMAEAFLQKYAGDIFDVYSAGFDPKPIHPYAIRVMREVGFDISNQQPKDVRELARNKFFAVAITVCKKGEEEGCSTILGAETRLNWKIGEPTNFEGSEEAKLAKFREARDQIHEQIKSFLCEKGITIQTGRADDKEVMKRKTKRAAEITR